MKTFKFLLVIMVVILISSCDTLPQYSVIDPIAETTLEMQKGAIDTVQMYTRGSRVYILKEEKLIVKGLITDDVKGMSIVPFWLFCFLSCFL